jgi:hypothetical protein
MLKQLLSTVVVLVTILTSTSLIAGQQGSNKYPDGPNTNKTPGAICENESEYRYPEHIKYCERNVSTSTKNKIIAEYDKEFGFDCQKMNRGDFKIDHFIPLSIGGSNDVKNLWPQHKSVYKITDPLESEVANLIVKAKIKQADAIRVIKECKLNLGRCPELLDYLKKLN